MHCDRNLSTVECRLKVTITRQVHFSSGMPQEPKGMLKKLQFSPPDSFAIPGEFDASVMSDWCFSIGPDTCETGRQPEELIIDGTARAFRKLISMFGLTLDGP